MLGEMSFVEVLQFVAPLIVVQVALAIFCLTKLTRDRVHFLPKWAWVFIIVFINLIGPLFYLIIGRERD